MVTRPVGLFLAAIAAQAVANFVVWGFNNFVAPTNPISFDMAFFIAALIVMIAGFLLQRQSRAAVLVRYVIVERDETISGYSIQPPALNGRVSGHPQHDKMPEDSRE